MASLADVAALAGVSISTASRVLGSSTHPVAAATRERVEAAARSLDFEPNLLARGLVRQRTQTVGVLVHDVTDEYFNEIARGIEDVAYSHGYAAYICNSDREPAKELHYLRNLRAMRVDAILFTAGGIDDPDYLDDAERQLEQLESNGSVIVRLAPHPRYKPDIGYSNDVGLQLAVDHLYELGHRRIGLLSGPSMLATSTERLAAFHAALDRRGLAADDGVVYDGDFTRTGGEEAARHFVAAGCPSTAVIGSNDQMAIGFVRSLADQGVSVPEDVSVVGFDDVGPCTLLAPPLTTVRVPLYQLGVEGMGLVLELLGGAERPPRRQLPLELIVRGSTAPPRR